MGKQKNIDNINARNSLLRGVQAENETQIQELNAKIGALIAEKNDAFVFKKMFEANIGDAQLNKITQLNNENAELKQNNIDNLNAQKSLLSDAHAVVQEELNVK